MACLPTVCPVCIVSAQDELAGAIVVAAHQVNLRQCVEDRTRCLVELNWTADVERAVKDLFGASQVAEPYADVPDVGQSHGKAVSGAVGFVQRHAAFGERERLIVPVLEHHDVRLVSTHRCDDVVCLHGRGESLCLPERAEPFLAAPKLRERDARQGMDEREMAAVAGRVQRRRRFGDVLTENRDVAHLPIAPSQLVMSETDGARVVRHFGILQRADVQGDRARLIAAGRRQPAVQPPQGR